MNNYQILLFYTNFKIYKVDVSLHINSFSYIYIYVIEVYLENKYNIFQKYFLKFLNRIVIYKMKCHYINEFFLSNYLFVHFEL